MAQTIILGQGVFYINEVAIGLTRGGGSFSIEKEVRQIEADGDRGPVKGRNVIDKATPKLSVSALEIIPENLPKMYAGVKATTGSTDGGNIVITGTGNISDTDYQDSVKWIGKTKAGKAVTIKVFNAINLENFEWTLADKDEVVASLTYTGCYLEESQDDYEPWEISFAK